jgi:colicin import membrane protein
VLAGLLVVLGVASAGGSRFLHDAEVDRARDAAKERAVAYADDVIAPMLTPGLVVKPITGETQTQLLAAIGRSIRAEDIARVRLWSRSGQLLFSTDRRDPAASEPSAEVRAAARGSGTIVGRVELEDVGKAGEPLFITLVPMRVSGEPAGAVAQVDQWLSKIDQAAREPAATVRVAGVATAGLGLLLLVLSRMASRRGRGKAEGFQQPRPFGAAVPPDVEALAAKLEKSESSREALEEQLAQLRTQLVQGDQRGNERARALEEHLRETEERARELEVRLRDADARSAESDRVLKDTLRRAEEAEAEAERLRQASTEVAERAERAEARVAETEAQLAEAEARASAAEARASEAAAALREAEDRAVADGERAEEAERARAEAAGLEATLEGLRLELEGTRARQAELEDALAAAHERIAVLEVGPASDVPTPVQAGAADRTEPESAEPLGELEAAKARIAELEAEVALMRLGGEDDGPSLRYRLARSAETRKRGTSDPEKMWS